MEGLKDSQQDRNPAISQAKHFSQISSESSISVAVAESSVGMTFQFHSPGKIN